MVVRKTDKQDLETRRETNRDERKKDRHMQRERREKERVYLFKVDAILGIFFPTAIISVLNANFLLETLTAKLSFQFTFHIRYFRRFVKLIVKLFLLVHRRCGEIS
jgi:hypothetical protein